MNQKKFEKDYFSGHYRKNVGNFQKKDLEKSIKWFSGWLRHLQKFVNFKEGNGRKVLEIGCSIGGVIHILNDRGFSVYASDISAYGLKRAEILAKRLHKNISFYNFDVQKGIPIDEKFDVIIAFEVIEHLNKPLDAIKHMKKKLKKGGILICSTPNGHIEIYSDPTHINVKTESEWRKIFKEAKFSSIKTSQVSFLPFFYKFSKHFHVIFPFAIYSKYIYSPLFIIAKK